MSEKKLNSSVFASVTGLIALQKKAKKRVGASARKHSLSGTGSTRSPFKTKGMDFSEVRAYQAGDDTRQIDWRVTAKYGKPYTKLYIDEKERQVFFLCDMRTAMKFATRGEFKSVLTAKITAFLGWSSANRGDSVRALLLTSDSLKLTPAGKGKESVLPLIKELSHASLPTDLSPDTLTLDQALQRSVPLVPKGAFVFICSDFHDLTPEAVQRCVRIADKATVTFVHIFDEMEVHLPAAVLPLTNGYQIATIDMADAKNRKLFEEGFEKQQAALKKVVHTYGFEYVPIRTDEEYIKSISAFCEGRF